ncbi:hypothetical protein DY000_02048320, partial [Brassica cretica]
MKMAPSLVRLYEQMSETKYFIAMGACTITGGMFSTDSYSTVRRVDKLIPVDVYLPGCPPKPEAVIDAITKLRKKIAREIYKDRIRPQRGSRFDFDRYGLVPRSSPRQADLILTAGGMFSTDSYSTVRVVDKLIHVDVYLPGCPPKPETVIDAITKLRKKIAREIYKDRSRPQR